MATDWATMMDMTLIAMTLITTAIMTLTTMAITMDGDYPGTVPES